MAVNEEARARRYEWRAGLLDYDLHNADKVKDAKVFRRAAVLARRVADARPSFDAAMDTLELALAKDVTAWIKGGRAGDRPTLQGATRSDSSVQIFRAARDEFSDYLRTDDYRAAVGRSRLDNWSEPTDEELLAP